MNENIIYIVLIFLCILLFYLYYNIKAKFVRLQVSLHLIFHDWDATLTMWYNINKQQASSQNKDASFLFEEVLRNLCVKDYNLRLEEVNRIL